MKDLFLKVDGLNSEEEAAAWAVGAALQRNKVYKSEENYESREKFRAAWSDLITKESEPYRKARQPTSDNDHCARIERICIDLSNSFGEILANGRLRFGTSQKAFKLYLKYLWALNKVPAPPHCPIDSIVLAKLGIDGSWTTCDDCEEYMGWISEIREHLNLTEWENAVWLHWRLVNS